MKENMNINVEEIVMGNRSVQDVGEEILRESTQLRENPSLSFFKNNLRRE